MRGGAQWPRRPRGASQRAPPPLSTAAHPLSTAARPRPAGIEFHDQESPLQLSVQTPASSPKAFRRILRGGNLHHDFNQRPRRVLSMIMYLSGDDEEAAAAADGALEGGETVFPCVREHRSDGTGGRGFEWEDEEEPTWWQSALGLAAEPSMCKKLTKHFRHGRFYLQDPANLGDDVDPEKYQIPDAETAKAVTALCKAHATSVPHASRAAPARGAAAPWLMRPRRGDAVLFVSVLPEDGTILPHMWHQGCPVRAGTKYTLQKFKEIHPDYPPEPPKKTSWWPWS